MSDYDEKRQQAIESMIQEASDSPAFPTLELAHPLTDPHMGMTLRLWLMGTIAAGMSAWFIQQNKGGCPEHWHPTELAAIAGSMADAIIREDVVRGVEAK